MSHSPRLQRHRGSPKKIARLSFTAHWSRNMTMLCVTLAVAVWVGLWLALR